MDDYPSLKITAMGHKGSGKTTFLLGMYADLSGGRDGYFLNATNPDMDLRLANRWEKLLDDGELPPPNPSAEISYEFMFLDGLRPLLGVDWLDYRGGALTDERSAGAADVNAVHDRLNISDSVYLVVDGGYLAEPITDRNRLGVKRAAGLRRMASLLQEAVGQREKAGEPPPSIVVLITKADLIPPERRKPLAPVVEDLKSVLSIAFSEGFTTLVCPVMLGDFGLEPGAKVSPADIDPHALHLPIIFSLAEYMRQLSQAAGHAATKQRERTAQLHSLRAGLSSGIGSIFRRGDIARARQKADQAQNELESLSLVQDAASKRAASLFAELSGMPIFRDGDEVAR